MSNDILALAEKSAETDLAFLLKAKEEAKIRMNKNPSQENINAFNKAKNAVDIETTRVSVNPGISYKTQLDAVAYLQDAGYKLSKSQFNRDVKARKIPRNAEGYFEESSLLGYAGAHLTPKTQVENSKLSDATTSRLNADADLKTYQAERIKLKLDKEKGLLMPRLEHERDLAARALFFKNEIKNFIHLHGAGIIHLVSGNDAKLVDLVEFWNDTTEIWLDAWSEDREFVVDEESSSNEDIENTEE